MVMVDNSNVTLDDGQWCECSHAKKIIIHPQVEKIYIVMMNEQMNVERSHMSACTCLLFQPFSHRLTSLTRQLEAVIIEVSMGQTLRLRTNP